ncbi:hypothetical protein FHS29_007166 [Saccharothrix tamanrassetensis]|uniref:Small secreted domain DUF320 n=1 Tax=Saccharothrix tamanrassetensis TaxID=1051531 RepID=A0A841CWP1_9PSEU|nr:hypothetical protein [Saccharothrix tamanrassetensis]MBB5960538.1 hypothetical protein [Saccharothrix tamanrassetensis]
MLGTGIASAQENVSPDAPPPPLDAQVRVPVEVDENNLGTPAGNRDLPEIKREINTGSVGVTAPSDNPLVRSAQDRVSTVDTSGLTRGNAADGDIVVPVKACGNAVAAGGPASATDTCTQSTSSNGDVRTTASNSSLAGNVAAVHGATPVAASGNAVAAGSNAYSESTAKQDASAGGDIATSGSDGSLSGNIAAVQQSTPVQATNNAVAAGGIANSTSSADSTASSGGALTTNGDRSSGAGNVLAAPFAPSAAVNGNSLGAVGSADTASRNSTSSTAGGEKAARNGAGRWIDTSGENASASGNVLQPQLAGPVSVGDNAGGVVGNADAVSATRSDAKAGGVTDTSGDDSTASGTIVDAPIALPVSGAGNSGAAVGNTSARHSNDSAATAGGETLTNGDRSTISGNSVNLPPAGAVDLCGNGAAGGGIANADCTNEVDSRAGGYNGSTGNDSVVSGNIGQVPVGMPAEGYGNALGAAGNSSGTATEQKTIRSGGAPNSRDDDGTVSSNVVTAPTAFGGQVFGNAGGAVANPKSGADSDTTIVTGGPSEATGKHGSLSGNIVEAPTSNPAQVFGLNALGVGNGSSDVKSELDSRSGGSALSTGDQGSLAGNVVSLPQASSPQVFGSAVGAGSNVRSTADNEFTSFSGGDVKTGGNRGSLSGNGLTAQPAVPLQTFGDTATAAGNGESKAVNNSAVIAGGDHDTRANESSLSGNLVSVPANAEPGVFGDAVTVGGLASSDAKTTSLAHSGGKTDTEGSGAATGHDLSVPAETRPVVHDVPVDVLGTATADVQDSAAQRTGEDDDDVTRNVAPKGIQLPAGVDSLMGPTEVPSLTSLDRLTSFGSLDRLSDFGSVRQLIDPAKLLDPSRLNDPAALADTAELPKLTDVNGFGKLVDPRKLPLNQMPVNQLPFNQLPVNQLPATQLPAAQLPVTQLPAAQLPAAQSPAAQSPAGQLPVGQLPVPQLGSLTAPKLAAPALPAPALPTPDLGAPALPAPGLGTPALPAPDLGAPALPVPALSAPKAGAPGVPAKAAPKAPTGTNGVQTPLSTVASLGKLPTLAKLPTVEDGTVLPGLKQLRDAATLPRPATLPKKQAGLSQLNQVKPGLAKLSKVTGTTKPAALNKVRPVLSKLGDAANLPMPAALADLPELTDRPDVADLTDLSDERSFGGTLPLLGGNLGVTPVIQGVLPLPGTGGQQRNVPTLNTLPIASPVVLPVVVPVPGVAQPRTAVPTPSLSDASVSGMHINPLNGVETPAPLTGETDRAYAPAMAGLDSKTVFGALETTTILPRI